MAYMDYNFRGDEKLYDIAIQYNTTVDEIMRVNNILPPYPIFAYGLPQEIIESGTLTIPFVTNGGQSFENYNSTSNDVTGMMYSDQETLKRDMIDNYAGFTPVPLYRSFKPGSQPCECFISANTTGNVNALLAGELPETTYYFPCYPSEISDNNEVSYNPVTILGRSEPFQYYQHSGPRSVNVSFTLHSDMHPNDDIDYIYRLVAFIEACAYPRYGSAISPTKVIFHAARNIHIVGILTNVSTKYSGPILDMNPGTDGTYVGDAMTIPKYAVVDISFTVTEVTGNPPSFFDIVSQGGYRI